MSFDSDYPRKVRSKSRVRARTQGRSTQWFRHKLGLLAIRMVAYHDEMLQQDAAALPVITPRLREALRQLNYLAQEAAE